MDSSNAGLGLEQVLANQSRGQILKRLAEQDSLFDYNVPPSVRTDFNDGALMAHLEKVYTKKEFVVSGPNEIAKYIHAGDLVRKKGVDESVYEQENWYEPSDVKLVVPNTVDFEKLKRECFYID